MYVRGELRDNPHGTSTIQQQPTTPLALVSYLGRPARFERAVDDVGGRVVPLSRGRSGDLRRQNLR